MKQENQAALSFTQLLESCETVYDEESGLLGERILQAYDTAVRRASHYRAPAELVLRVKFTPEGDRMMVSAKVETKLPTPKALALNTWIDPRTGQICLEDPRQIPLDFPGERYIGGVPNV